MYKVRQCPFVVFVLWLSVLSVSVLAQEQPKLKRIVVDDDKNFPMNVTRIDFDKGPKGLILRSGIDISELYVPLGCIFESSFPGSFVGVEPYNVGGRSGGHCAANHKPLYQGTIIIRFCAPGNKKIPATVKTVGFWTSHVAIDGTTLEAYDIKDKKIGEIKTLRNQRDFLAIKSKVPINYIKIVPNTKIDPDFAIDDLVFDKPIAAMKN